MRCTHEYRLGRPAALSEVALTIRRGVTGLIGVNGAGKTTLLKIMAGILKPSEGSVQIDARSLYGRGRRQALAQVGYMPQHFNAPGRATVSDVVRYIGWLRGMSSSAAAQACQGTLDEVGLAGDAHKQMRTLSGGMVRRVALAQSLIAGPRVLLLDEPTTGLDAEQRAGVRALVAERAMVGTTIISSHIIEDVSALADHLVVLDQGRVLFDGSMSQFRESPGSNDEDRFLRRLTRQRSTPDGTIRGGPA